MTGKEAKVHRGVQAAIRSDPLLRGQEIAIAVRAGVVALYGCLDNFQDVEDAVKAAKLVGETFTSRRPDGRRARS